MSTGVPTGAPLSLEVIEGPGAGLKVPLRGALVIGSGDDADLSLSGEHTAPRHARVSAAGDRAIVEDLGSDTGTFVNRVEIHGPATLRVGDELQVGVSVFTLRTAAQVARHESAVIAVPPVLAVAPSPPRYISPAALADDVPPGNDMQQLERLLDVNVRFRARTAPLAVLVLVALVVAIYLGAR
jgi:Inner membrane component of T3SS, cytoplasmic domain